MKYVKQLVEDRKKKEKENKDLVRKIQDLKVKNEINW